MNRLLTPKFEEAIKDYPLYSQDGKARDAVCVAIFTIGNIRWFVLEGGKEGDDTILYCIVVGLGEDEYGYVSLKELAEACRETLIDCGVLVDNIQMSNLCTYERTDILYSARKEGSDCGRNITAIKIL